MDKMLLYAGATPLEGIIHIVALIGAIALAYSVFIERERHQDFVKFTASFCLFVYALYIDNKLFIIAMGGMAIASIVEYVEIRLGVHKHSSQQIKEFKQVQ